MTWICVAVRLDRELMLPTLPMAVWIWAAVLPALLLAASDP
jgi:hypothetical protein